MTSLMQTLQKIWPGDSFNLPFNLQRREKIILAIGAAAFGLFLVFQLVVFPITDYRARMDTLVKVRSADLAEIQALKAEKEALTRDNARSAARLSKRRQGFNLFSLLESLAGGSGIKQIESMKPSTTNLKNSPYSLSRVDMKINGLLMEQLVNFLHKIETSDQMVWIKGISITRSDQRDGLINVLIQVETFER